jgi:hypothetical protein
MDEAHKSLALRLFQWAILATKPLRVYEWRQIMGFIRTPAPTSLRHWRAGDGFTSDDGQLEKQIRSISGGLVEVAHVRSDPQEDNFELLSLCAGAGSLNAEEGETRIIRVIHDSVRTYFLEPNGGVDLLHYTHVTTIMMVATHCLILLQGCTSPS